MVRTAITNDKKRSITAPGASAMAIQHVLSVESVEAMVRVDA